MHFNLTDEQELLRSGLARFLATRYDLDAGRAAARDGGGWQPHIWRAFAEELGILAAVLPESAGGSGGGAVETMVIAEELGRAGVLEPFIDVVVVAGGLLQRCGGGAAGAVLEALGKGTAVVSPAASESDTERWDAISTIATRDGADWVLDGAKTVVVAAPVATHLLITARLSGHPDGGAPIGLFLTEFDAGAPAAGMAVHRYRTIDDRPAADLTFTGWRLPAEALVDPDAGPSLALADDQGAAAVCAEAVGAMRAVLADTVAYCKQRQQFGVPISSFQVLAHRMVDMHMEVEQSAAAAILAGLTLGSGAPDRARAVSAAKATVGRAARFVGQNAVQLHGGMGMTEELAVGHYFKRLTALQYEFGSTDSHRARYAELTRPGS